VVWDRGWWNKKLLNGKRSAAASVAERGVSSATASPGTTPTDMETASSEVTSTGEPLCPPPPPPAPLPDPAAPGALEEVPGSPDPNVQLTLEGFTLDEVLLVNSPMLPYLAMVAERSNALCRLWRERSSASARSTCWLTGTSGARRPCVRPSTRAAGSGRWTRCRRSLTIPRG